MISCALHVCDSNPGDNRNSKLVNNNGSVTGKQDEMSHVHWDTISYPLFVHAIREILMAWVCITQGSKPIVIRTQTINIFGITRELTTNRG